MSDGISHSSHSNSVVDELPRLFRTYLKTSTSEARDSFALMHAYIFDKDIRTALDDARLQLDNALKEALEVCRAVDGVAGQVELSGLAGVREVERAQLTEDAVVDAFAKQLAVSLTEVVQLSSDRRQHASTVLVPTMPHPDPLSSGTMATAFSPSNASARTWHQDPSLVLEVLSYLPIEDVLTHAEDVCTAWRYWLGVSEVSRFFWVGAVQREYPQELKALLAAAQEEESSTDFFNSDWRTIAMCCVAGGEEMNEEDNTSANTN